MVDSRGSVAQDGRRAERLELRLPTTPTQLPAVRAMADGARDRLATDVGVGITGVAGPGGGTDSKPIGYVCVCVTTSDGTALPSDPVLPGDRAEIRDRSVTVAMHSVRRLLARRQPA